MVCRPGWFICIQTCAPWLRAALAQALNGVRSVPLSKTTSPPLPRANESIMTLPVMMRPTPPLAKLPSTRAKRSSGNCPGPARLSAIAALAIRFWITVPLGSTSGENNPTVVFADSYRDIVFHNLVDSSEVLFQFQLLGGRPCQRVRLATSAGSLLSMTPLPTG